MSNINSVLSLLSCSEAPTSTYTNTHLHYPQNRKKKDESPEIEALLKRKDSVVRAKEVVEKQLAILDAYSGTLTSEHAKSDAMLLSTARLARIADWTRWNALYQKVEERSQ